MQHAHVLKISCIWRGLQFCPVVFISTVAFCLSCIFSVLDSFSSNNGPNIQVRKNMHFGSWLHEFHSIDLGSVLAPQWGRTFCLWLHLAEATYLMVDMKQRLRRYSGPLKSIFLLHPEVFHCYPKCY